MYIGQTIVLPVGTLLSETKSIQVNLTYLVFKRDVTVLLVR